MDGVFDTVRHRYDAKAVLQIIFVGAFIDRPICVFVLAHAIAFPVLVRTLIKIAIDENMDAAAVHFAILQ